MSLPPFLKALKRTDPEPRVKPPAEGSLFERPRRSRRPMVVVVIVLVLALLIAWMMGYIDAP